MTQSNLVSAAELAQLVGCSVRTIWKWRELGCPSYQPVEGGRVFFDHSEVMNWVRNTGNRTGASFEASQEGA